MAPWRACPHVLDSAMSSGSSLGDGRYVIRGVLGEGAQGTTYEATDLRDGRAVAIKRFAIRGARNWKDVELAEREARVLSTLDHPLVPRYIQHFEADGVLYLVMEKVEGETLEAMRRRLGVIPEDEVRRFLADADRALTYLHGRASPIVHRDIKPRNVVRRPNGSYVLVDFGAVSELLMRRGGGSTVVGTMGYMAPEQFQGRAAPTTDIYAVGATALAALTGAEPETLAHQGLRVDVRGALEGRASDALITALEHMLEPDPTQRATSLAGALDAVRAQATSLLPALGAPSTVVAPPPDVDRAKEDATVKSIRKLLWALWGLSWILVPASGLQSPFVIFALLVPVLVVTWHQGAVIRAILRALNPSTPGIRALEQTQSHIAAATASLEAARRRIDVEPNRQVRVHATDLRPDELLGRTERDAPRAVRQVGRG